MLLFIILVFLNSQHSLGQPAVSARSLLVESTEKGVLQYQWYASSGVPYMRPAIWLDLKDDEIKKENKLAPTVKLAETSKLVMPVKREMMLNKTNDVGSSPSAIQIWYIVKKGETLYRIARHYAGCSMAELTSINQKKEWTIKEGEKIMLGWIQPAKPVQAVVASTSSPSAKVTGNARIDTPVIMPQQDMAPSEEIKTTDEGEMRIIEEDVIGSRTKNERKGKSCFILHNTAIPGSLVTIYNPMMKRQVKAKVLGPIPAGMYKDEIKVILSSAAARELGIIDFRFKVGLTYEVPAE